VLGWGSSATIDNAVNYVKKWSLKWKEAVEDNFDLWNVQIDFHDHGKLIQIQNQKKVEIPLNNQTFVKFMTNYCSVGTDARITLGNFFNFLIFLY
jgi:hypothetical protein